MTLFRLLSLGLLALVPADAQPREPLPTLRYAAALDEFIDNPILAPGPDDSLYAAGADSRLSQAVVLRLTPTGDVMWSLALFEGKRTIIRAAVTSVDGALYLVGVNSATDPPPEMPLRELRPGTPFAALISPLGCVFLRIRSGNPA